MQGRPWDLVAVFATASVAVIAIPLGIGGMPLRALLGVLLVLLLPGYAVTAAAIPGRRLELPMVLMLSLGESMAITALGGLLLNLTPWGLGVASWTVFLGGVTLAASAIALRRQTDVLPAVKAPSVTLLRRQECVYFGLAALVTVVAAAIAYVGAATQEFPGFTQLWVVPEAAPGQTATLHLAVSNMEHASTEYRLELQVAGKVIREWATIGLQINEQWETSVTLPTDGSDGPELVEALLYRLDAPEFVYRRVAVWQ